MFIPDVVMTGKQTNEHGFSTQLSYTIGGSNHAFERSVQIVT